MQGLEAIRDRILHEAKAEADTIRQKAKEQAGRIEAEAEEQAEALRAEAGAAFASKKEAETQRTQSMSELETRRTLLEARQRVIDDTFSRTLARLGELEPAERKAFYVALLKQEAEDGQTVTFNRQDQVIAEEVIRASGKRLELDPELGQFTGGFILSRGRVSSRLTFEEQLRSGYDEWVRLIRPILFRPEDGAD